MNRWWQRLLTNPVRISFVVFVASSCLVIGFTFLLPLFFGDGYGYQLSFMENLLVEAHGMLFDILIISVFILWLQRLGEKQLEKRRYLEEINDYRFWKSEEAGYRIAGAVRRLNNLKKTDIDLSKCFLKEVNLERCELRGAKLDSAIFSQAKLCDINLSNASMKNADFFEADLRGANLTGANLRSANLSLTKMQGAIYDERTLFPLWLQESDTEKWIRGLLIQGQEPKRGKNMTKRINYREVRYHMQTGDVVAFGGPGHISQLIKFATGSDVSHVGLILRTTVMENKSEEFIIQIIESTPAVGFNGINISRFSICLDNYDGEIWWLPLKQEFRQKQFNEGEFFNFISNVYQYNKPYDMPQVIKSSLDALDQLPYGINGPGFNAQDFSKFFCAQIAKLTFEHIGLISNVNRSFITPIELCRLNLYEPEYFQLKGESFKTIEGFNSIKMG